MALTLTLSNRFEFLQEHLLHRLAQESANPMVPQTVIVPSAAVRRQLELAIARRQGVCAHVRFIFLGQWLWETVAQHLETLERSPLDTARLSWAVYHQLGNTAFTRAHPPLAAYLEQADAAMRLELSQRIAQVFDDTLTYRPEWVEAWRLSRPAAVGADAEVRDCERWQGDLWRRVTRALGLTGQHPFLRFLQENPTATHRPDPAPPGVHLFALPALPPLHLDMLRALGRTAPIRLYTLNPCAAYWFEIVDAKRLSWLAARRQDRLHETGNRLLAAWGRQTQAHIDLLFADEGEIAEEDSDFFEADTPSLLASLQNAILNLEELGTGGVQLAAHDRSLELHVCHGLHREIEVLHDQLLACLDGPDALLPGDILVVTPDLASAAPLIDGIFGNAPPELWIPYTLTGCPQTRDNPAAQVLVQLIGLLPGRFPASAVFDLLQQPPVAQQFGLDAPALAQIRAWIAESGIRWGLDGAHRAALELPALDVHSFADGLNRLFLAYAQGDDPAAHFDGQLGAGDPEGQMALTLGRLWRYVSTLAGFHAQWQTPHQPEDWQTILTTLLDAFIPADFAYAEARRELQSALVELHRQTSAAPEPLPASALAPALLQVLTQPARGGMPSGSVTFASMSSLRNLPYRMICVIGLNDGVFPGAERPAEFDLLARLPRRGDRQRRQDERNLFLDLLLAARERFYLSYTGRSIRDNSPLPPSLLVSELFDTLRSGLTADAPSADPCAPLIVEHPLQAFSPDNFRVDADPRQRSYHAAYCPPQRVAPSAPTASPEEGDEVSASVAVPFFGSPLAAPDAAARQLGLDAFIRFFRNPCRALLREHLGVTLYEGDAELADAEPFTADWPGSRQLLARLLPAALAGADAASLMTLARAGTEYPPGALGRVLLEAEIDPLLRFCERLRPLLAITAAPPQTFSLSQVVAGELWHLQGSLTGMRPGGWVGYRYDTLRPGDFLEAWWHHLARCAHAPQISRWYARDASLHFAAVESGAACDLLAQGIAHYRQGMLAPLHFFPRSAFAYATEASLGKARACWQSNPRYRGEDADPYYRLALRGVADPLNSEFVALADALFGPLLRHCEVIAA